MSVEGFVDGILYFGDKDTDDSFRFFIDTSDLLIQKRISGTWTTRETVSGDGSITTTNTLGGGFYPSGLYFGDKDTEGSWRLHIDTDGSLFFQRLESGTWLNKKTITV